MELSSSGEARFRSPDGRVLAVSPPLPPLAPVPVAALCRAHHRAGLVIGPETALSEWDGSPFDGHSSLDWFLGAAGRSHGAPAAPGPS